jgi:hypothetical protein
LGGSDLYAHLIRYFQQHLNLIRQDSEKFMDVSLLEYYTKQWVKFTEASTYVHHLFTYLNRHWVKREIDEGRKTVHDVGTVSCRSDTLLGGAWLVSDHTLFNRTFLARSRQLEGQPFQPC